MARHDSLDAEHALGLAGEEVLGLHSGQEAEAAGACYGAQVARAGVAAQGHQHRLRVGHKRAQSATAASMVYCKFECGGCGAAVSRRRPINPGTMQRAEFEK